MPTPLKRQIGYKREPKTCMEATKKISESTAFKKVAKDKKLKPGEFVGPAYLADLPICKKEATAELVVAWIKDHPMFKWSSMCIKFGIHKGNFGTMMKSDNPVIKDEILDKIVAVIELYGFK